ncbi:MAG: flagellar protein FlgN [Gemmatimonadetes bacterium]|jgi:flagellar biosynthesis/type III secretory pathway chaperone|nr:flagellar protein FlgN [Gemmatimonadota bacterium]
MNDPFIIELIDIINEEIRLFNHLLQLTQEEQTAIVEDDLAGIETSVMGQQQVASEAHLLEARRLQVVEELSLRLGGTDEDVNLARLIEVLEDGQGEELARMRETLLELNQRIRTVSENNAFLIRQSVRYTDRCLDILTGQSVGRGMYGKFGRTRPGTGRRSLLNQTA